MNHPILVACAAGAAALLGSAITGLWAYLVARDRNEHHPSRKDSLRPASFRWRIVLFRAKYLAKLGRIEAGIRRDIHSATS